jgi:putative endonuclease
LVDLPAGRQAQGNMYYMYVLKRIIFHVGLTCNPERRIAEHNSKWERTTRSSAPFDTLLIEEFQTRPEARIREKYLKSGIGKEYLKSL